MNDMLTECTECKIRWLIFILSFIGGALCGPYVEKMINKLKGDNK